MEAAIRTAYEIVTGEEVPFEGLDITPVRGMDGVPHSGASHHQGSRRLEIPGRCNLKVMVAHGLKNDRWVIDQLRQGKLSDYHFIELMACPGGCLGGGGQPIPTTPEIRDQRGESHLRRGPRDDLPQIPREPGHNKDIQGNSSLTGPVVTKAISFCTPHTPPGEQKSAKTVLKPTTKREGIDLPFF